MDRGDNMATRHVVDGDSPLVVFAAGKNLKRPLPTLGGFVYAKNDPFTAVSSILKKCVKMEKHINDCHI